MFWGGLLGQVEVQVEDIGTTLDFWVIGLYMLAVLGFGSFFGRFSKTTSEFFFSGAKFSWWLIAMSLVATGVGSHSFVKYAQIGYEHGFSSGMAYMNDWFFIPLFMFGWLPLIYFSRVRSIPEYVGRRFNNIARLVAVVQLLFYMLGYVGYNLFTLGKAAHQVLGVEVEMAIIVIALVSAVYITAGGQTAVIFTDLLQGAMLMFAGLLLFAIGLDYLGGGHLLTGLRTLWDNFSLSQRLPFADYNEGSFNFVGVFWQDAIAGSIGFLFVNQGLMMRFMAAKSMTEGRKCVAVNVLFMLPVSMVVVGCAGWLLRAFVDEGILAPPKEANQAFVTLASFVCQPGVFGFVLAALSAALMSTMDTLINASASLFVYDVYQPYLARGRKDRHYMFVARVASFTAAMVGLGVGLWFAQRGEDMYKIHAWFQAVITPPLVTTVLMGALWKRMNSTGAIMAMAGGMALLWIAQYFDGLIKPFADLHGVAPDRDGGYPFMSAMFGIVATAVLGTVFSLATNAPDASRIDGLWIGTLDTARRRFKGAQPRFEIGRKARGTLRVTDDGTSGPTRKLSLDEAVHQRLRADMPGDVGRPEGLWPEYSIVRLSAADMQQLKAEPGDLVYVSDARGWLGGLRSMHGRVGAPHNGPTGEVWVHPDSLELSSLLVNRAVRVEKFF